MNGVPKIFERMSLEAGAATLRDQFRAMWVKSEKALQIPAANQLTTEGTGGRELVDEYAQRIFARFRLLTWPEIMRAWDEVLIDCQRRQAAGQFPAWNYGTLEAGLMPRLKPEPVAALPEPGISEDEQRLNDRYANPDEDFVTEKIKQFADHAENEREYMLFGPHLSAIWEAIEARAGGDACRRARVDARGDRLKYRKLILEKLK